MAQQEQLQQHHHQEQQQQREQQQQLQFQQELTHYNKNLCNLNYIMEDPERRKRREREKYERQQGIQSDDRETSLFGEPRRLTPGEADAEITAALGEFIDARDYMNNSTVGIYRQAPCASNTRLQVLSKSSVVGVNSSTTSSPILSSSASSSASVPGQLPTLQQQQQQPQQHYQQQQRVPTYLKQADNKPPYNGRGGYPGQPMKNDIPSSSGMAPPRGPPRSSSSSSSITNNNSSSATNNAAASATSALPSSLPLGPPVSTQMPNGREKSYLGPPAPALSNGGRFVPPPASAKRPSTLGGSGLQPPPPEKDISKMISEMTNNYRVTPLTSIAATPHAPMRENYNLNGPNKFKYAFDAVDPIGPLNSPPATSSVSTLMTPLLAPIAPITSPIAPLLRTPPQASHLPLVAPSLVSKPLQPSLSMSYAVPPTQHLLPTSPNTSPTAPAIKPLKTEKNYTLEKQDSCLENDLELSESDDERKKESRSAENSSNSSESDSSESGSEASSKGDLQQQKTLQHHQEQQQLLLNQQQSHHQQHRQFTGTVNGNKKKYSQTIIASGPNTISGLLTSSGLGGSSAVNSAGNTISGSGGGGGGGSSSSGMGTMSSSSSSNKTPSPTDSNRWTLSRFFPKPANQAAMDSVSPGGANTMGNVSMKVPGILPGGAQIIPESIEVTTAIVKNENLADATRILEIGHNEGNEEQQQQQRYGVGISVTVKKETVEQEQQLDALTNNQIKRESRLSDSGSTGSESNSDSISGSTSSDSVGGSSEVMPLPGPGETLQLPGVPAAITTVIRVPQTPQHRAPKNSVTLTPFGPLPASPKPRQKRSRKKKVSVAHSPTLDSSDEDEPMSSTKKQALELSVIAAAEADTDAENTLIVATALPAIRKGRGRPRKQAQPQLQQSGNLSSASASSSQAKGPTLTAAKKPLAKSTCSPPVIAVAAASRKREHSSNSSSNGNTPTKKSNAVTLSAGTVAALTLLPPSVSAVESSEDESSCSSCSTKSSSSSGSDTEAPAPMTTVSPSTEAAISVVSAAHNPAKKRIVKINKLCSSHKTKQRYTAASSSNSSSSETEEQQQQKQQLLLIQQQHLLQPQSFVLLHPQQEQHNSQRLSSSDCSSSASSGSSSNSSSGSSSDEDETHLGSGKRKSDKKKICTLTRIFNPKEGGAKKQGQVVIIDQSEEQQQHQEQQQLSKTRATPIQGLGFNLASPARTTTPHLTSLMCKISLTKLARVLPEWYKNSCRLSTTEIHQQEQTQQQQHQQERKSQSNGHLSSRSTDEGRTTKDQQSHVSNGYVGGREGNLLVSSVKFEHGVKPEPELDAGSEAKFKQTNNKNSVKQEFMLKQELPAAGRRRKRSSSSSSSPYKEKKRKKEKTDQQSKDLLSVSVMLPANNHERLSRDKLELLHQETSIVISSPKKVQQPIEQPQEMQSQQVHLTAATLGEAATVASVQTAVQPTQLPTTCTEAVQTTSPLVEFPPGPRLIYRSHFDNEDEPVSNDPMKNELLLQEAIKRKRAADSERDSFMQMTLYLEAIVYFLLTADAMERSNSEATWTLYKDTLSLIKYISSKNRPYQQATNGRHESHNIVGILSLRCQSLISLKLYKLRRANCRVTIASCSEFFRSGRGDILNSNTPSSISPSNSVCSQGSGSNTPPGKIVPQDIHNQLCKQNEYLTYVNSAHELWDQADRLVRSGNHIDFIRKLDHENGPLTLHSTMHEVFRYVQAGLKTLRNAVSYPQSQ